MTGVVGLLTPADDHNGTGVTKAIGDGAADAASAAGDERDAA